MLARLRAGPYKSPMHITLVDDSISFDGFSPANRPLGGAEKAFASLAGALVRRGHDVHVYNRARFPLVIEGAHWETLDKDFPAKTDVLVAFRKPSLLGSVRLSGRRVLWATASGRQLELARKALDSFTPAIVFQGLAQTQGFKDKGNLPLAVIAPGVRPEFCLAADNQPDDVPTAVVTTHPAHGLSWLLDLWASVIRPAVPNARLLLVSSVLAKAVDGDDVPEELQAVAAKAVAAAPHGVEITRPRHDGGMAEIYRKARVHLYPGHAEDMACWTLAESQACGLPAVARGLGAVRERIKDGQTGQVVPDEAAFANVAIQLLTNDDFFWGMSRDSRLLQRERSWDVAAADFDTLFKASQQP